MSVLEIVIVGKCEVFVFDSDRAFFFLGREAHRSVNGASVLYKMLIFPAPTL